MVKNDHCCGALVRLYPAWLLQGMSIQTALPVLVLIMFFHSYYYLHVRLRMLACDKTQNKKADQLINCSIAVQVTGQLRVPLRIFSLPFLKRINKFAFYSFIRQSQTIWILCTPFLFCVANLLSRFPSKTQTMNNESDSWSLVWNWWITVPMIIIHPRSNATCKALNKHILR